MRNFGLNLAPEYNYESFLTTNCLFTWAGPSQQQSAPGLGLVSFIVASNMKDVNYYCSMKPRLTLMITQHHSHIFPQIFIIQVMALCCVIVVTIRALN